LKVRIPASYYQQFDADYRLDVPAEGFNGWQKSGIEIDLDHTALVVMHAWDCGTNEEFPGWFRHVEYLPRAQKILKDLFPPLLATVRSASIKIFHVVGGGDYYQQYPGYQKAKKLEKNVVGRWGWRRNLFQPRLHIRKSPARKLLDEFREKNAGCGGHNKADIACGFQRLDFPPEAKPIGDERIAENTVQLFGLCQESHIDHLIYVGFAINWCLLLSPGGMAEMTKLGLLCSTISEAVTAVENHETARNEWGKKIALWRVGLAFGFVFDFDDFFRSIQSKYKG
jgi:hypothetical protein